MSNGEDQHRFILRLRTAGSPRSVANPSRRRGVIGEVTELDRRHPKSGLRFVRGGRRRPAFRCPPGRDGRRAAGALGGAALRVSGGWAYRYVAMKTAAVTAAMNAYMITCQTHSRTFATLDSDLRGS